MLKKLSLRRHGYKNRNSGLVDDSRFWNSGIFRALVALNICVVLTVGWTHRLSADAVLPSSDLFAAANYVRIAPRSIHLSLGDDSVHSMTVTWSTHSPAETIVQYRWKMLPSRTQTRIVHGQMTAFEFEGRVQYIHRAQLLGLNITKGGFYEYRVGDSTAAVWSEWFRFRPAPSNVQHERGERGSVFALYGDMGYENAAVLPMLIDQVDSDLIDCVIHVGDFAYDMQDEKGRVGDLFMQEIQPVASKVPYMTCPGNHEETQNFTQYRNRFSMPGRTESLYYSFDYGNVHFVAIDTELYYYDYLHELVPQQYEFVDSDLAQATSRAERPFLVLFGHRPPYCSANDDVCGTDHAPIRVGLNSSQYGIETLLQKYQVDIAVWGHRHSYERFLPTFNNSQVVIDERNPYENAQAPMHVITGSAGCKEGTTEFSNVRPFSAFRSRDFGWSRMEAVNRTHLHWQQISVTENKVIDDVWIIRDFSRSHSDDLSIIRIS